MRYLIALPPLAAVLFLSGCIYSDPWMRDVSSGLAATSFKENKDDQIRIGYLARYLAEPNTRASLESRVLKTEYVRQWGAVEHSTFTSIAADVAVGQLGSAAGGALGTSVLVLGLLSGDGSLKYISQAFLPETLDDKPLRTSDEAQAALLTMMDRRLQDVARSLRTDIECFHGCETPHRLYRMTVSEPGLESRYPYVPKQILVALNIGKVEPVPPADPISALVGFPVKWQTTPGDSASVRMFDKPAMLTKGPFEVAIDNNGFVSPSGWRTMDHTTIGTQIIATLYATPHLLWGAQRGSPSRIFYGGEAYGFISNGYPEFVNKRLAVSALPDETLPLNPAR